MAFSWQCPYCYHFSIIQEENLRTNTFALFKDTSDDRVGIIYTAILFPNSDCKKVSLKVGFGKGHNRQYDFIIDEYLDVWTLRPESSAKQQPEYIPKTILNDYYEACLIRDKSPKASATLARRCLQGMIRNFWNITKSRLIDEINSLEDRVTSDVWNAIVAVKDVGNIGAHMEKDVNLVIDVDPEEAQLLIELIEQLFKDWYVAKHDREIRMKALSDLAERKKAEKAQLGGTPNASDGS